MSKTFGKLHHHGVIVWWQGWWRAPSFDHLWTTFHKSFQQTSTWVKGGALETNKCHAMPPCKKQTPAATVTNAAQRLLITTPLVILTWSKCNSRRICKSSDLKNEKNQKKMNYTSQTSEGSLWLSKDKFWASDFSRPPMRRTMAHSNSLPTKRPSSSCFTSSAVEKIREIWHRVPISVPCSYTPPPPTTGDRCAQCSVAAWKRRH